MKTSLSKKGNTLLELFGVGACDCSVGFNLKSYLNLWTR